MTLRGVCVQAQATVRWYVRTSMCSLYTTSIFFLGNMANNASLEVSMIRHLSAVFLCNSSINS